MSKLIYSQYRAALARPAGDAGAMRESVLQTLTRLRSEWDHLESAEQALGAAIREVTSLPLPASPTAADAVEEAARAVIVAWDNPEDHDPDDAVAALRAALRVTPI